MSDLVLVRPESLFRPIDPSVSDKVAALFREHDELFKQIETIAEFMRDQGTVEYFVRGNVRGDSHHFKVEKKLFDRNGAIAALAAAYWDKVLKLTDVLDCMPQARRDEWFEAVRDHQTPPFTPAIVSNTLLDLLASREKFFAERIDGVFRRLSPDHVTNSPMGFRKRMIVNYVVDPKWAHVEHSRAGTISDLRFVIARFMGRGEPHYSSTTDILRYLYRERQGEWVPVDGGALRMRVYKKGTLHLEVHDDMAWRLNRMLAHLHPNAIPEEHRRRPPSKRQRKHTLVHTLVPFEVLGVIANLVRHSSDRSRFPRTFGTREADKHLWQQVCSVMEALGAVYVDDTFIFDYPAASVLEELLATGVLPEQTSHQYYPTPDSIAQRAIELAEIGPEHSVLEPSAGCGALVKTLAPDQVTCVEINALHCDVLRARGFRAEHGDFLDINLGRFDRVVMNPPFSDGRWQAHLERAAGLVELDGILVAILPASAQGKSVLPPGWSVTFTNPTPFPGTSVSVTIMRARRSR